MLEGKLCMGPRQIQTEARAIGGGRTDSGVQLREMIILLTKFIDYFRERKNIDPTYVAIYSWLLQQFEQTPQGKVFFERNPSALSLARNYANGNTGGNGFFPQINEQQQVVKIVGWLYDGRAQQAKAAAYKEVLDQLRER